MRPTLTTKRPGRARPEVSWASLFRRAGRVFSVYLPAESLRAASFQEDHQGSSSYRSLPASRTWRILDFRGVDAPRSPAVAHVAPGAGRFPPERPERSKLTRSHVSRTFAAHASASWPYGILISHCGPHAEPLPHVWAKASILRVCSPGAPCGLDDPRGG